MKKSLWILPALMFGFHACKPQTETSSLSASSPAVVNGTYTIRVVASGKCLDVPNSSPNDGVQIQQFTCNGSNAQKWRLTKLANGNHTIINVGSNKGLDIAAASQLDRAPLQQFTVVGAGQPNQQFSIEGAALGNMLIRAGHSGKVLDVVDESRLDGARIQQFTDKGLASQRFALTLGTGGNETPAAQAVVANGIYTLSARHSGKCLDVPAASLNNSVQMQQFTCNGTPAQLWRVTQVDKLGDIEFFSIINVASGKALDIDSASLDDGAQVHQFTPTGQQHQQFSMEGGLDNVAIRARHSNKVLDVINFDQADGAKIQQFTDGRQGNQRWILIRRGN